MNQVFEYLKFLHNLLYYPFLMVNLFYQIRKLLRNTKYVFILNLPKAIYGNRTIIFIILLQKCLYT